MMLTTRRQGQTADTNQRQRGETIDVHQCAVDRASIFLKCSRPCWLIHESGGVVCEHVHMSQNNGLVAPLDVSYNTVLCGLFNT